MVKYKLRALALWSAGLCLSWTGGLYAEGGKLHHVSADVCAECHGEIYKQWKGSMHAKSTALEDPIHATFYKKVMGDPKKEGLRNKKGKYPVCLQCHAPNAARDMKTKLDSSPAYSEGVNCVACHMLTNFKGVVAPKGKLRLGLQAYDATDKIQAPHGFNQGAQKLAAADDMFGGASAAEGSKPNPHLGAPVTVDGKEIPALPMESNPLQQKTSDACMGCHDQRNNAHGVPLCQTGSEYSMSKSEVNCLACHMPISNGMADHSMGGGHDNAILKRSIVFNLNTEKTGDKITAKLLLKNQQPHSLPTGAPFRNIYIKVMAYDAGGEVIWENAQGHPKKDDPQAYMRYALSDDAGKDTLPPTATQLGEDTRLKPHEERTLSYDIPAKDVYLVRAEVYYNLLWPILVKKFKHLPEDLTAPVLIADAESTVGG